MAGRRADSGPVPPGDHFVRLSVSEETYQKLRKAAFDQGLTVAAFTRKIVTDAVSGSGVVTEQKKSRKKSSADS